MENITAIEGLNKIYPMSCFFVLSVDQAGQPNGMIASWVYQTSFEPPMIAVSIGKARNTHKLVAESKEFVIALPNKEMEKAVLIFGNTSGRERDKFSESDLKTQKSKFLKTPVLTDATLNFECKVVESIDTGDHTIFVGEVLTAWANEGKKTLMYMGKESGRRLFEEF